MFVSKTYGIEDCKYFNDGSSVGSLEVGSGVSCTSNGDYITITTSTSGEKYVKLPINTPNGNWEFSSEIAELGTAQYSTFQINNAQFWGTIADTTVINLYDSTSYYTHTPIKGDKLRLTYINGVLTAYVNDTQLKSRTVSISNLNIGFYTNQGRVQHLKNIMLKPL